MLRRDLRWALLLLPLPLMAVGMARAADRVGKACGAELARVMSSLAPSPKAPEVATLEPRALVEEPPSEVAEASAALASKSKSKRHAKKAAPAPTAKGLRVSAQTVLQLVARGAAPRGVPVPAQGARPAGLRLVNVSGLGIGVRDGDVLTDAGGRPVRSVADVIGVVVAARARLAPEISGHFFRGAERWAIVVEQPYPKPANSAARSAEIAPTETITEGSSSCTDALPLTQTGLCPKSRKL